MVTGKIKIHWVTLDNEKTAVANALGYNSHNSAMRKFCAEHFEFDENAPIAITITPADFFVPIPGKKNILFTMWEAMDVPKSYIKGLNAADVIVVPSTYCAEIFRPHTDKPIYVCFEGVDPEIYKFHERKKPDLRNGEKFRMLWLGAPNPRKGYYLVLELVKVFENLPNIEIYLKTTCGNPLTFPKLLLAILNRAKKALFNGNKKTYWKNFKNQLNEIRASIIRYQHPELAKTIIVKGKNKNIFFDSRKLSTEDLVQLYNSAHVFLAPHSGEGWGLTLCEAMATGCPSIASLSTGVLDFFNKDVGYPIRCEVKKCDLQNYDIKARMNIPDTRDFVQQVFAVMNDYKEALKRGKKASYRIKTEFTWKKSAKRLKDIVEEFCEKENIGK